LINAAYIPEAAGSVANAFSAIPAVSAMNSSDMEVIKCYSFVQISKRQIVDLCSIVRGVFQTNLSLLTAPYDTVIKSSVKTLLISAYMFDIFFMRFNFTFWEKALYAVSYDFQKDSGSARFLSTFYLLHIIMLLLLALYKGNIPHAAFYKKFNNITRYLLF
jgi:hypothetical protein